MDKPAVFVEGALASPLPGPASEWDTPMNSDYDMTSSYFENGYKVDTGSDDTAPKSVSKDTVG